jgi:hypothetical protein
MPYGFVNQEAPQAHAQKEAQKDASSHTPPASQVVVTVRSDSASRPSYLGCVVV